jgi:hypothetical protein
MAVMGCVQRLEMLPIVGSSWRDVVQRGSTPLTRLVEEEGFADIFDLGDGALEVEGF